MISEFGKAKALDTLVIDDEIYALTYQKGQLGYMREGVFIPVNPDQLKREKDRAGSPTWSIKPEGRENPRTPATVPKVEQHKFRVRLSYQKEKMSEWTGLADDEKLAKNKAIRWYASLKHIPFSQAYGYFNKNPLAIEVTKI
jgi:hypothetical protein